MSENRLTDFQLKTETALREALARRGIQWSRGAVTPVDDGIIPPGMLLQGSVESVSLWIYPNDAFIGGRTTYGKKIDRRFEAEDYHSTEILTQSIVLQVLHYLDGGTMDVSASP